METVDVKTYTVEMTVECNIREEMLDRAYFWNQLLANRAGNVVVKVLEADATPVKPAEEAPKKRGRRKVPA